jgi:hypothetical protein
MSLDELAKRLRALPDKMRSNLAAAERETQKQAHKEAVNLSSGSETAQTLARARHPYSRRAPNAAFDPAQINVRTGLFRASWVSPPQVIAGKTILTSVLNLSPEAAYMEGTKTMVPRLIAHEVLERIEEGRQKRISDAIDKTLEDF